MKFIRFIPLGALLACMLACIEDTIQLENISNDIAFEHEIAIPLIKTEFIFDDITGHGYDSLIVQSGDTIFLYLILDIGFQDTLKLGDMGENMDFEFINLYFKITNMFPIGMDFRLYLYDSIQGQNIDTIWFSGNPDSLFLKPAQVDDNGLVIEDQVDTSRSSIGIDEALFDNLFHVATNLVIDAVVPSTGNYVKILDYYRLQIQMGLDAKGRYENSSDSIN